MYIGWQISGPFIWVVIFASGLMIGSGMPILFSYPMLLKEIGPKYAGSAGGIISTLQLIGAVVIPTYLITPLAGDNYHLMFGLGAACMVALGIINLFLPEVGPKKERN